MTLAVNGPKQTWTRRQLTTALRAAGWRRMSGPSSTYVSPDDATVLFQLDRYQAGIGVVWRYFAERRELPATMRPPF